MVCQPCGRAMVSAAWFILYKKLAKRYVLLSMSPHPIPRCLILPRPILPCLLVSYPALSNLLLTIVLFTKSLPSLLSFHIPEPIASSPPSSTSLLSSPLPPPGSSPESSSFPSPPD
eukprot:752807-Hanusia_phi.AAC.6